MTFFIMESTSPADIGFPGGPDSSRRCPGVVNLLNSCEDCLYLSILSTCVFSHRRSRPGNMSVQYRGRRRNIFYKILMFRRHILTEFLYNRCYLKVNSEARFYGFYLSLPDRDLFRDILVSDLGMGNALEVLKMTPLYLIGLIIVIGLVAYLFVALLKPELFQ